MGKSWFQTFLRQKEQGKLLSPPPFFFKGWIFFLLKLQGSHIKGTQQLSSIVVIQVKKFQAEITIEIQLVRPTEVCGKI